MKKIKEKVLKFFEISSKLKRTGAFALAFLLSFLAIAQGIRAENATKNWIQGYYYKTNVSWGQFDRKWINGKEVFCVNPEMELVVGSGYNKGNISEIMSKETQKKIELIHHYGYALSNKNDKSYVYTQVAIWEALGYSVNVGSSNGASDRNGDYRNWKNNIDNKINIFLSVPSWSGTTVKGKVGQTITLNGEGKISGSHVIENVGHSVWAENGNIKITIKNFNSGEILLRKLPENFENANELTLIYKKSGSQTVAKLGLNLDPPEYRVNLEVEKTPTKARVLKVGEDGEKIKGAVFEMCYSKDFKSSYVYPFTTDGNGYTEWDTWNIQGRTVYVREKSVPYPYVKSDEVKTFKVTDGGKVELKFVNKKAKSTLEISKTDMTGKKELEGAKLKLLKGEKKIDEWISGKTPHVVKNLDEGKYSLIEEIAPNGYIISEKIDFILKAGENKKVTMKDDTTKVKITKTGTDTGKTILDDCEFEIIEVEE
ncbi:MSCRAMM family protein [Parvimonas parva]|uniref:Cys-Gln thioester bond-forming surface protein n=1 Tax=Parvimonas parva TaxID=2769485 RepID=A0ABS1C983_9FIRM|nr:SpaA isopeptide-forming pilin-related protein [Parvimonas parva]MBK1468656.1 Cys-Gln thioester bond-forming surface protein [Parvimonas parva]